jgi:Flp pilus assembly protein TadD
MGDVNRAVEFLEKAATDASDDANTFSDLSAAYIARASRRANRDDWSRALTAAQRARQLQPDLREPQFNEALALEALGRVAEARQSWRAIIDRGEPGWRDEAESHLRVLPSSR